MLMRLFVDLVQHQVCCVLDKGNAYRLHITLVENKSSCNVFAMDTYVINDYCIHVWKCWLVFRDSPFHFKELKCTFHLLVTSNHRSKYKKLQLIRRRNKMFTGFLTKWSGCHLTYWIKYYLWRWSSYKPSTICIVVVVHWIVWRPNHSWFSGVVEWLQRTVTGDLWCYNIIIKVHDCLFILSVTAWSSTVYVF